MTEPHDPAWVDDYLPRVLPTNWRLCEDMLDGSRYESREGLRVIVSGMTELDGRHWLHASVSRRGRLPSYDDLKAVKALFIGRERKAIQVFAADSEHVNLHPFVLHLWHCASGDVLPDFTQGGKTL